MTLEIHNPRTEARALRAILPLGISGPRTGGNLARKRYQRGALRREGNLWILRWREDVVDAAGKVIRVERRVRVGTTKDLPTKSLARRVADRVIDHVNQPTYRPGMVATVEEFAAIYEREVLLPTFKPSAARSARSVARSCLIPVLGKYRLDEITGQVPQLLINAMRARGNSRKTIRNAVAQLSAMLKAARGWGYLAAKFEWETLFLPVCDAEKEVRCFTPDEAQRIIESSPEPWNICFALMAYLGLRSGEALGLMWANIDLAGAVLCVRQSTWCGRIQTVKSKTSRRDLPLPEALTVMLADYRKRWRPNSLDLLFSNHWGTAISASYVRKKIFHPIRERLGIPQGAFHAFRHGHATTMFSEGANPKIVQDSMGHSDIKTTMKYTHQIPNDRREAVERATQAFLRRSAANLDAKPVVLQ
jgi:integrase